MDETLEDQLLHAALLCGMKPNGPKIYRLQLFFIANKDLGSKSKHLQFQRALITGVKKGLWKHWLYAKSGDYEITEIGYNKAKARFGAVKPRYPALDAGGYRTRMEGWIDGARVVMLTRGNHSTAMTVFIDEEPCRNRIEACQILADYTTVSLPTKGGSAVEHLYGLAIDHDFDLYWEGEVVQAEDLVPTQLTSEYLASDGQPAPEDSPFSYFDAPTKSLPPFNEETEPLIKKHDIGVAQEDDEKSFPEGKETYELHRSRGAKL